MILSAGFRPFFLLSGLTAVAVPLLALTTATSGLALPSRFSVFVWHGHEMLFGYGIAALAGFLLAAVPNWTGRPPLKGLPLLGLISLWLAARIAVAASAVVGLMPSAILSVAFLLALAAFVAAEIIRANNWRNLVVVAVLALLAAAEAANHAGVAGFLTTETTARVTIALFMVLISLVGGRIIPGFTRNWLVREGVPPPHPAAFGAVDRVAMAATVIGLALWVLVPRTPYAGIVLGVAALMVFSRLARWRGLATRHEPLLWILHVGYAWVAIGLALGALAGFGVDAALAASMHAFTSGAVGTMTLAVMSRATLGHTGRDLRAGPALTAAYVLITVGAATRVLAYFSGAWSVTLLWLSAAGWIAAFALFVLTCGPMLLGSRQPAPAQA